jgi:two-component system response regulator MprA
MPYVLVVDDDPDVRQALVDGLVIAGACDVEPAGSAAEALASVERQRPDAAIIDVTMPRVSGLSLAARFIELGIPSLIISGDPEHQQMLAEVGCPLLAKPFHLDQFVHAVRALLDETELHMARLADGLSLLTERKAELRNATGNSRLAHEARWRNDDTGT